MLRVLAILFLPVCVWGAATEYVHHSRLLLADGKDLRVYHVPFGGTWDANSPLIHTVKGKTGSRLIVYIDPADFPNTASTTACTDPCDKYIDASIGDYSYRYQYADAGGTPTTPLSAHHHITGVYGATETSWTLPIEVLGIHHFSRKLQFTIPSGSNLTGAIVLWIRAHHVSIPEKLEVKINASDWKPITDANITVYEDGYISAGQMGGGIRTMRFTTALPTGTTLAVGTNTIEFRVNKQAGDHSSGLRIIDFNLMRPQAALTQVSVSATIGTFTCSTTCPFVTTDEIRVFGFKAYPYKANGVRTVASTPTGTTFTATVPSGITAGTYNNFGITRTTPKFNVMWAAQLLIPQSQFTWDTPSTWSAPSGADASNGATLFAAATIKEGNLDLRAAASRDINGKCISCHTTSATSSKKGMDLAYFNFSNQAIITATLGRGLSMSEARDIAAHIRGVDATPQQAGKVCVGAWPWNPPYQPGPGLDALNGDCWAAGAGIDAVLDFDADNLERLETASMASTATWTDLITRETPIPIQFPDIVHWWPRTAPEDYWTVASSSRGDFSASSMKSGYDSLRTLYSGTCADTAKHALSTALSGGQWFTFLSSFPSGYIYLFAPAKAFWLTNATSIAAYQAMAHYDLAKTMLMRSWEVNQEFCLQDIARSFAVNDYTNAQNRQWVNSNVFDVSPNLVGVSSVHPVLAALTHNPGMTHANATTWQVYESLSWYLLQLVLSYHTGDENYQRGQDWQYTDNFILHAAADADPGGFPLGLLHTYYVTKGLQHSNNNATTTNTVGGFSWYGADFSRLTRPLAFSTFYNDLSPTKTVNVIGQYMSAWYTKSSTVTPAQYEAAGLLSQSQIPENNFDSDYLSRYYLSIPQLRNYAAANSVTVPAIVGTVEDWFAANWAHWPKDNRPMTVTCTWSTNYYSCPGSYFTGLP